MNINEMFHFTYKILIAALMIVTHHLQRCRYILWDIIFARGTIFAMRKRERICEIFLSARANKPIIPVHGWIHKRIRVG